MKKYHISLIISLFTIFSFAAKAQTGAGKINGSVTSVENGRFEAATISLQKLADSAVVKFTVADKGGNYSFENIKEGLYIILVSAIGYESVSSEKIVLGANQEVKVKPIVLTPKAKTQQTVTIISKRPLIEQKPGKMVLNVDASPTNTGLNALELLEKSPGVTVDNDGNISVKGKQGVLILIDGKPTYMSATDLTALLKNMQSTNLDQIEIMTNPPAKYDASGNSGIINIKTKKGITKGMNGSTNLNFTQGLYSRYNGSLNLNYRNQQLNLFGSYNGGKYEGYNMLTIARKFYESDYKTLKGLSDQISRPHFKGNYHNVKVGMDYNLTKKTIAGFVVNGGINTNDENPVSTSFVRHPDQTVDYQIRSKGMNVRNSDYLTSNFNLKHTFDSTGTEITVDLDYANYNGKSNTLLNTGIYDAGNSKKGSDVLLNGIIPSDIKIYSAKTDYVRTLKGGVKLEAGLKTSFVKTDNKVDYLRNDGLGWKPDNRTNHFVYNENINAAYSILSKTIKKWELTAGLRIENTIAKGHQESNDSSFKRNYTSLFPNVGIGYNANEKNQLNLSYSRRITRPDYDDLNPFVFFLDSLTYGQGNPYLQPQFTHNFEFSHTLNRFFTTTLNYTSTEDIITELLKQDTEKKLTFQTRENFSKMRQFGIAVSANFPATKFWNINIYTNLFNNHYTGVYSNGKTNDPVDIQFSSFSGNMTNSFTITKNGLNAEISGWYRSKVAEGLLIANTMYAVNAAISKTILKKKGTIKLGIRDIFYTQQFSGFAKYSDVDLTVASKRDTRQVNLSFTYRFGKNNIAPARRKSGGAEDEQSRVKSGN